MAVKRKECVYKMLNNVPNFLIVSYQQMKVLLSLFLPLRFAGLIINPNNGEQRLLVVASVIAVRERRPLAAGSPSEQLGDFLGGSSGGGFQCDHPRPPRSISQLDPSDFSVSLTNTHTS